MLLAVMVVLALRSPVALQGKLKKRLSPRVAVLAGQIAGGLRAVTSGGPGRCLLVCSLSLLVLPLTAVQLLLFLHAFTLSAPLGGLLLLLVVVLSAGSLPLKIPAFGMISAAAVLPVAGIQGPAAGGYLLVSQFLLSSQTVTLALLVLAWWFVRGTRHAAGRPSDGEYQRRSLRDLLLLGSWGQMQPVYVEVRQGDSASQ